MSILSSPLTHVTCLGVTACLSTTYILYVFVEKKGPAFLPMLSDTFVPAPGNYISRMMLSMTALTMGCLGFLPYYNKGTPDLGRRMLIHCLSTDVVRVIIRIDGITGAIGG